MTGIERLRTLAGAWDEWGLGGSLAEIADQIERELREERDRWDDDLSEAQMDKSCVTAVYLEMNRHCLGHEGMEDSPVARWARELRVALGATMSRHESDAVAGSPYDAMTDEDRESAAWVREHGGLDAMVELSSRLMTVDALRAAIEETCTRIGVERTGDLTQDAQAIWREIGALRSRLKESVPRAAYERHLARRQRQIDESHAALRRRNARIGFLVSELNRANHENREEFMRRAGDYTAFTDEVCKLLASELRYVEGCSKDVMDAALEALDSRLMPEGCQWPRYESGDLVMFGDCVENRNGTCMVNSVRFYSGGGVSVYGEDRGAQFVVVTEPVMRDPIRKARPKVFAADGEPLEVGQTVWHVDTGDEFYVSCFSGGIVNVSDKKGGGLQLLPSQLTHQRPVLDADGVPIKKGDTVFRTSDGREFEVTGIDGAFEIRVKDESMEIGVWTTPCGFTHTKPEVDTWQRIEEDVRLNPTEYTDRYRVGRFGFESEDMRADLVRRCRALAERERGE